MPKNKPGRNEACWCGSGKKFKYCHYGREAEAALPFQAIASAARKAGEYKTCLHPYANKQSCGKVISAHTLQRARVLREIADDRNRVLTFNPPRMDDEGVLQLQERGWHDAATFTAFCDEHDAAIFTALEKEEFSGSLEQCFLVAYRAISWEMFQKVRAVKSNPKIAEMIDRGANSEMQHLIQEEFRIRQAGFEKGLEDLRWAKAEMDKELICKNYSRYAIQEFVLETPMFVASTGGITPNRSISGQQLQTLHDTEARTQWLSFGVDISRRGVSVVFIWRLDDPAPTGYMKELGELSDDVLPGFLFQFFFAHCENTYFSHFWWNSLDTTDRSLVERLIRNSNPYYFKPEYDFSRPLSATRLIARRSSGL